MTFHFTFLLGLLCGLRIYLVLCDKTRQTAFVVVMRCKAETPIYVSMMNGDIPRCAKECAHTDSCTGFNFDKVSGNCHFFKDIRQNNGSMTYSDTVSVVHTKKVQETPYTNAFWIHAGSGQSVVDLWTGQEQVVAGNYRNKFLGCWESLGVQEVIINLRNSAGGLLQRQLVFNGHGSSIDNWFTSNRYLGGYVPKNASKNIFAMSGVIFRNFFINQIYGGCGNDAGWLVVLDPRSSSQESCGWEKNKAYPAFLSSFDSNPVTWNNTGTYRQTTVNSLIFVGVLFALISWRHS